MEVAAPGDQRADAGALGAEHQAQRQRVVEGLDRLRAGRGVDRDPPQPERAQLVNRAHEVTDLRHRDQLAGPGAGLAAAEVTRRPARQFVERFGPILEHGHADFYVAGHEHITWDAERLAGEVSGPVELLVIEDGNHVANNRPYRYRPQTADWMAERLGAAGQ